jgi:hypothetical protein
MRCAPDEPGRDRKQHRQQQSRSEKTAGKQGGAVERQSSRVDEIAAGASNQELPPAQVGRPGRDGHGLGEHGHGPAQEDCRQRRRRGQCVVAPMQQPTARRIGQHVAGHHPEEGGGKARGETEPRAQHRTDDARRHGQQDVGREQTGAGQRKRRGMIVEGGEPALPRQLADYEKRHERNAQRYGDNDWGTHLTTHRGTLLRLLDERQDNRMDCVAKPRHAARRLNDAEELQR